MATATQYTTMKTLSMYYGTGALAKKNGVAIRPSQEEADYYLYWKVHFRQRK